MWDAGRAEVPPVIALLEKGSKVRRNVPNGRLRAALRAYVLEARPAGPWLFPQRRCPRLVARHCAEHTVRRLCQRVGLAGVSPHSFRRLVVNLAMRAGNRLETVQKWLGHSSAATTLRHYWTDDPPELDLSAPPVLHAPTSSGDGVLAERLIEATCEIHRLRQRLALTGGAAAAGSGAPAPGP